MYTVEQFAVQSGLSERHVRRYSRQSTFTHHGQSYEVVHAGTHETNGTPKRFIKPIEDRKSTKHLRRDARKHALDLLNAGESVQVVADTVGVGYHTIYRLAKHRNVERKRRTDAGTSRIGVHPEAEKVFSALYIANAQCGNVKLAFDLMARQFEGIRFPYSYFVRLGKQLEPIRLSYHQDGKFEQKHTPRVMRDLWGESKFMRRVSLDGWVVPDRVLHETGLGSLLSKTFKFNDRGRMRDVSMVCVFAFDECTGFPLSFEAFEKSITGDDILKILLDVVVRWGRPETWLLDNGTEFTNEQVQRFLRGLYSTEEHSAETRIIFSEAYQPTGKGRHERQHRIFKDEFCAFSRSYSPNQQESRKPTKQLSYVKPTHTLGEWKGSFGAYLNGFYQERQRVSWMNPFIARNHPDNASRPRTLCEAFAQAYATYTRVDVDQQRLAFLYAKKFVAKLKTGLFVAPASFGLDRRMRYLPSSLPLERYAEQFEIVVNPQNYAQAWVCDLNGNMVCEANSIFNGEVGPSREIAVEYRKVRNRVKKLAKEKARAILDMAEIESVFAHKEQDGEASSRRVRSQKAETEVFNNLSADVAESVDDILDAEMVDLISNLIEE